MVKFNFYFALFQFLLALAREQGRLGGHALGKSTHQLTLWADSGPQVLSQRTAAPHHTERCRGAAGSGPGEETRMSPEEGKGYQEWHESGLLKPGYDQNHVGGL